MRTIEWQPETNQVRMIDQRQLPGELVYLDCRTAGEVTEAIRDMAIRGAPAIGVAGAFGMALDAFRAQCKGECELREHLQATAQILIQARPTAVNLAWAINRILALVEDSSIKETVLAERILSEAQEMAAEDIRTNLRLARHGASLINDGDTIIHHCNTGSLAVVEWGTALGAIRFAHESGKKVHVLVDETRPLLQGARLTAWECEQYGIPYEIISDGAAGYFLHSGKVSKVFFGADRVAANGDVVNKVGTYMLSLAAHANHVPVISVFPISTLDLSTGSGDEVTIEERDPEEVLELYFRGKRTTPIGARARNPAFDITPNELITTMVTERGIIYPPFKENLASCVYNNRLDGE